MINRYYFLVIFFLGLSFGISGQEADKFGFLVKVGDEAPDFSAELTNGKTFQLSENRGKVVMLQFTASWCSVCRKEMPYIERDIWEKLKSDNFVLIGVDRDEPMEIVKAYSEKVGVSYPLALDPEAKVFGLYADLKAGVTRNIIIDENGKIIYMSRLFKLEEFKEMTEVIFEAVEKLK